MYASRLWWLLRWLGHDAWRCSTAASRNGSAKTGRCDRASRRGRRATSTESPRPGWTMTADETASAAGQRRLAAGRRAGARTLSRRERDDRHGRRPHPGRGQPFLQMEPHRRRHVPIARGDPRPRARVDRRRRSRSGDLLLRIRRHRLPQPARVRARGPVGAPGSFRDRGASGRAIRRGRSRRDERSEAVAETQATHRVRSGLGQCYAGLCSRTSRNRRHPLPRADRRTASREQIDERRHVVGPREILRHHRRPVPLQAARRNGSATRAPASSSGCTAQRASALTPRSAFTSSVIASVSFTSSIRAGIAPAGISTFCRNRLSSLGG